MARRLFGTDGIRGVAGEYPLDRRTMTAVGEALGTWCKAKAAIPEVVIGMDTRESGPWIAECVAGGLALEGVRGRLAGLITTPGVAWLTRNDCFVAGVMISASHNPYTDNGLKVFEHSGYKLTDQEEEGLEKTIFGRLEQGSEARAVSLEAETSLDEWYLHYLESSFPGDLRGRRIVVDCGHGAASQLAPALLGRLGAEIVTIGCQPDGRNINLNSGALHVDGLRKAVVEKGAAAGFAFDGDADRCIAVTASGRIVDGDAILLMVARYLRSLGKLNSRDGGPLVVATVMSNLGLERALDAEGIRLVRTPVGDRYVLEEMLRTGARIGGEQSGHVIFIDQATTGDGMLTALRVLEVMKATGQSLDELAGGLHVYPQKLVNVRVKERRPLEELAAVQAAIGEAEKALGAEGRVLVRFSGTEPLARVMVEGPTNEAVDLHCREIASVIGAELGAGR